MTSGKPLTARQQRRILHLAGHRDESGKWLHSYAAIARIVSVCERTVRRYIRVAAVESYRHA